MSEQLRPDGRNEELEFERQDLSARNVCVFLAGLALMTMLVCFAVRGMYGLLDAYERNHQPAPSPLAAPALADTRAVTNANIDRFPQPRLEGNERVEINDFRQQEDQTLNSYGWVDQHAGTVRIPIDRAMQLIAQRGLPTRPQAGNAPAERAPTGHAAKRGKQ